MFTDFMARADLVLAIGSSLTEPPFGPGVPPGKTIIHSTNDAGDIHKEYRPDHAVIGDAALVLDALIAEVGRQKRGGGGNALAALKDEIAAAKKPGSPNGRSISIRRDADQPVPRDRDLMRTADRDNMIVTHDSAARASR